MMRDGRRKNKKKEKKWKRKKREKGYMTSRRG